jgi:hypothetical protein
MHRSPKLSISAAEKGRGEMDERYDRLICPLVDAGLFRAGVIANQGVPT